MKYLVVVEGGPNSFGANVPDLPGCVAVGATREEVTTLIHEAVEFHIEGMREDGLPVPAPSSAPELVEVGASLGSYPELLLSGLYVCIEYA